MSRLVCPVAVVAAGLFCGCQQRVPADGGQQPAPAPEAGPGVPLAPMPRLRSPGIVVRSVRPPDDSATASRTYVLSYGLTRRDLEAIGKLPGVSEVIPVRFIPSEVRYLDRSAAARVVATAPGYAALHRLEVTAGRFLGPMDGTELRNVCVLSSAAAEKLFPFEGPVGKVVTTRGHDFTVVGVLKGRPSDGDSLDVHVPIPTATARFGEVIARKGKEAEKVTFHEIIIRPSDGTDAAILADAIRENLKKLHQQADWEVTTR